MRFLHNIFVYFIRYLNEDLLVYIVIENKIKQKFWKSYLWLIINFQSKGSIRSKMSPSNSFSTQSSICVHKAIF